MAVDKPLTLEVTRENAEKVARKLYLNYEDSSQLDQAIMQGLVFNALVAATRAEDDGLDTLRELFREMDRRGE